LDSIIILLLRVFLTENALFIQAFRDEDDEDEATMEALPAAGAGSTFGQKVCVWWGGERWKSSVQGSCNQLCTK
jgi:hypothetical protein